MEIQVIPRMWGDGSVHLETRLVSFHHDDTLVTHLDPVGQRFVTACGTPWFGKASASGFQHSYRVTCPECRMLLASLTLSATVDDDVRVRGIQ